MDVGIFEAMQLPFMARAFATLAVLAVAAGVVGTIGGRAILTAYLAGSQGLGLLLGRPTWHANEVFAGQGIADYKNFLRFRIAPDGGLTVYAIGVDRPPRFDRTEERPPKVKGGQRVEDLAHMIETLTVVTPPTAQERARSRSASPS